MKRFTITTLGCKVNQYDGCALSSALSRAGLCRAREGEPVDLVVINTCCVTTEAMRKSRQAIRRGIRGAPGAAVLVVGCYSDYEPGRIHELLGAMSVSPGRAFVAGHHDDLARQVDKLLSSLSAQEPSAGQIFSPEADAQGGRTAVGKHAACPAGRGLSCKDDAQPREGRYDVCMSANGSAESVVLPDSTSIRAIRQAAVKRRPRGTQDLGPIDHVPGHQRAFVKVQDGCDAFCSYCVVPYTRVRLWSRGVEEVLAECRALRAAGHREIVLSGVFLGAYGRATAVRKRWTREPSKLPELIRAVAGLEGLWRVRLSSLEPGDLDEAMLATFRDLANLAPHLHLPLQSGSERILRRMNRQYTAEQYRRTIDRVRAAVDTPALTTDIIVGFPGESDEDFAATLDLARHAGFAKIHAFPFSAVEGTAAWEFRHEAPPTGVVRARMAELAALERETARAYRRLFVGHTVEALVEAPRSADPPHRRAMTDRYLVVRFPPPANQPPAMLTGQVVRLRIHEVTDRGLRGQLVRGETPPVASTECPRPRA